ncbi:hypothetical protein EBZ80_07800 [bacterium]|nr:hypothetical protein [bacterium]
MVFLLFYPNLLSNRLTLVIRISRRQPRPDWSPPEKTQNHDVKTGTYATLWPLPPPRHPDLAAGTGLAQGLTDLVALELPLMMLKLKSSTIGATGILIASVSLALPAGLALAMDSAAPRLDDKTRKEVRESTSKDRMLEDNNQFEQQASTMANAEDCLPLFVRQLAQLRVLYMHCSPEALRADSKGRKVTENFSVPDELARRFNFWRRVYGLWAKDQYVLHSSEYPEVILEIIDASKVYKSDFLGREAQAESYVSGIGAIRRASYRQMLMDLHRDRKKDVKTLSPVMQRIARLFEHIQDPMKYAKAARTLRFQRGQRDFIAAGLQTGPKYLDAIEPIFAGQGVPKELSRLAYIESSFNLVAVSKVGASGVYQIMPETGRQYLRMVPGIDERNEPVKAATAAAKLLKMNYDILGSWPLAITAYNHGVGGLKRAVRATGRNDLGWLVQNYTNPQFQFASKNFFCGFLAILATLQESEKLFPDVAVAKPVEFRTVKLTQAQSLQTASKAHGATVDDLLALNRDIQRAYAKSGGTLPRGYVLKIPAATPVQMVEAAH